MEPPTSISRSCRPRLSQVIDKYFGRSYLGAVSALINEEKISVEELKELIREIETHNER